MSDMTPAERARADEMLAELHERGYRDIDAIGDLRPGARVRHRGHRWSEAIANGTGNVVAITEKPDSPWSVSYRMPDVEMVVLFDTASFGDRLSMLAQYHAEAVDPARWAEVIPDA